MILVNLNYLKQIHYMHLYLLQNLLFLWIFYFLKNKSNLKLTSDQHLIILAT